MNLSKEKYLIVRKAQAQGVRTLDELKNTTNISIENDTELRFKLDNISMEYVSGTTIKTTFDVKNMIIKK